MRACFSPAAVGPGQERQTFPEILFAQLENVNTGFLHMHRNSVINEDPGHAIRTQNKAVSRA